MRFIAAYTMRGRYQALVAICGLAIASLLIPPLSLFSSALYALVVLRKGSGEGAWVLLFALLALGAGSALQTGNPAQGISYGLLLWGPSWPVAVVLRESRSLTLAMETALGMGLCVVLGVYAVVSDPAALWRENMQLFLQALSQNAPEDFDPVKFGNAMDIFSHYLTGTVVGGSLLSLILGLFIARWLQANLYNPGGFGREFSQLRLHKPVVYLGLAFISAGLLLKEGNLAEIAWNLNGVFLVLFILAGFSILHAVLLGRKGFLTFVIYLAIFFILIMLKWLLLLVAFLGISDPWLDWRKVPKRS